MSGRINIAIVGAVGRGKSFRTACQASGVLNIHAACDIDEANLESAREKGARNRIWLRSQQASPDTWMDLDDLAEAHLPDNWRHATEEARKAGHGGGDYFEVMDFVDSLTEKRACPIGIHEAMDMTLPGLISQRSIQEGGKWLLVPDSRAW